MGAAVVKYRVSAGRRLFFQAGSLWTLALFFCSAPALWGAEAPFLSHKFHWAVTEHKFELAMERIQLKEPRQRTPVILSHGFLVNSRFLDLTPETSLAKYLAAEGFDVWNLSLRGTGRSLNPLGGRDKQWSLDDIIRDDLAAVIGYVQKRSGSPKVNWVGFEMGGLLLYGFLQEKGSGSQVGALVTVGAPATFTHSEQEPMKRLLELQKGSTWHKLFLYLDGPLLGRLLIPLIPTVEKFFLNPENIHAEVKEKLLESALAPVNAGMLDHISTMIRDGEFVSAEGDYSYWKNLAKLRQPVLLVGGEKDAVAPPGAIQETYRAIKSKDRSRRIFGSRPEDSAAYGHYDLILGKKAREEVFPFIARWLKRRDR